jgi:hypothetical protein
MLTGSYFVFMSERTSMYTGFAMPTDVQLTDAEPVPNESVVKPTPAERAAQVADELAAAEFAKPSSRRVGLTAADTGVKIKLIPTEGVSAFWLNVVSISSILLAIGVFAGVFLLDFKAGCLVAAMLIAVGYLAVKVASDRVFFRIMDFLVLMAMFIFGFMGVSMWL